MNLSARERRLLVALGVVVVLVAVWLLVVRPSEAPTSIEESFPTVSPSVVVTPPSSDGGSLDARFVVPVGAHDPFKP